MSEVAKGVFSSSVSMRKGRHAAAAETADGRDSGESTSNVHY